MPSKNFPIDKVIPLLKAHFHTVKAPIVDLIQAQTNDPFKVLVATILSARTKDETTTKTVTELFKTVQVPHDLDKLSDSELDKIIWQVGFHREKTKHLKQLPSALDEKFGGKVPKEIEELIQLPGVGRKTANLVRSIAFDLPAVCVDVHVHRISNRWGYIRTKDPLESEMALRKVLPEKYWIVYNSYLVAFGQNLCYPRKPRCSDCPLAEYCAKIGV